MSAQHTPGPWAWEEDFRGLYGSGKDNEVLTYASRENMWLTYGEHREANAALIAAAPELLEALTSMCLTFKKYPMSPAEKFARAVIEKATGRPA